MKPIELSEETKTKIEEYKRFTRLYDITTNYYSPENMAERMYMIRRYGQVDNFREFVKYTIKLDKQNEYEMKNYFYQSYEMALVSAVGNKKLNLYVSRDILSYLVVPKLISLQSMMHIFECYVFRSKKDEDVYYYKIKL